MSEYEKNQEFELLLKTSDGDEVFKNIDTILVKFGPKRNGIVSSWLNGGYNEELSAVFNHQLSQENIDRYGDGGILDFLKDLSKEFYDELDLRSDKLSGLITSADMGQYSIACESYRDIEVMAISTAGVRVNAVSAGDKASYYEINGQYDFDINQNNQNNQNNQDNLDNQVNLDNQDNQNNQDNLDNQVNQDNLDNQVNQDNLDNLDNQDNQVNQDNLDNLDNQDNQVNQDNLDNQSINQNANKPGTINSLIFINCRLDESSLLLAEMIAVEAKAVALRELMTSSNYSDEIATGTGTDGIAIFSNLDSENTIENVSKHAKIGELIAKVVIDSVKEALANLQWLTPSYQLNAFTRLDRLKYNLDDFYENYLPKYRNIETEEDKKEFIISLLNVSKNPELVANISLIIHLLDQYRVGLLSRKTVLKVSNSILDNQLNRDEWSSMRLLLTYIIETQLE